MISRETENDFARDEKWCRAKLCKIVPTQEILREIEMISRETGMISRETKRFRAKVQTSLQTADSDWFQDFRLFLDQTASKQAARKHIEQQAW